MTHDYKAALDAIERGNITGHLMPIIKESLTIAAEYERVKKERDELERELNDNSEWFFRWIARGKGGSVGMTIEQCVDIIWNHPA